MTTSTIRRILSGRCRPQTLVKMGKKFGNEEVIRLVIQAQERKR